MGAPQATGPAFVGVTPRAQIGNGTNQSRCMWVANNALYVFCFLNGSGGANINGCGIFKSTDFGTTWNQMDAANAPLTATGSTFYDVANNQIIVGLCTITFPGTVQPIFLKTFNLATDTWGANFAAGGPNSQGIVQAVFKRPDSSILAIYDFGPTNPGGTSRLRASVWNGVSWSASIDIGAALLPLQANGQINVSGCAADMDTATGNIHIAYANTGATIYLYQLILANNTLSTSNHFGFAGLGNNNFGNLIVANGNVYITAIDSTFTNNILEIGTPLTAPVFSQVTPANMQFPGGLLNSQGNISWDGTKLYWMVNFLDATFSFVRYQTFTSTDGGNTWAIVPDNSTAPFFYDFGSSPLAPNTQTIFGVVSSVAKVLVNGGVSTMYAIGNVHNSVSGIATTYFLNSQAQISPLAASCNNPPAGTQGVPYSAMFTASGGTAPYTFAISAGALPLGLSLNPATGAVSGTPSLGGTFQFTVQVTDSAAAVSTVNCSITIAFAQVVPIGGGYSVAKGGCRPFNFYDLCLLQEIAKLKRIRPDSPCSVPPELWNVLPWESDFGSVPALAVPFRKIQSIVTPAPAAGDTVVTLDIVPQGYDGILTGFYWRYNGLNFVEGSGDILWRIQINMRFVKDLSNVGFTIGSPQTPMPMVEGGQLLQSRQRFAVIVNVPNLSGTIQVGSATITAGLFGFFWPKGVPGWTSR